MRRGCAGQRLAGGLETLSIVKLIVLNIKARFDFIKGLHFRQVQLNAGQNIGADIDLSGTSSLIT